MSTNFFIITGGAGSGKTTVIEALKKQGYPCVEEAGRQIMQKQAKIGGNAFPWDDIACFRSLLLNHAVETYKHAMKNYQGIVFFDRGILDLVAYNRLTKTNTSPALKNAIEKLEYSKKVFVAPPWKEIYRNDLERRESFQDSVKIHKNIVAVYNEYGFELIELPKVCIESRVEYILSKV